LFQTPNIKAVDHLTEHTNTHHPANKRTEVTIGLTQEVTDKTLPGEYRCKNVTVYDTHYNHKTFAPDIRFRIENVPGDHDWPELVGWQITK
jgi:hypothetical protein